MTVVTTPPRRTFPTRRAIVGLILSIGILFFWELTHLRVMALRPTLFVLVIAGILGCGLAFGQVRYSLVALTVVSIFSVRLYIMFWESPWIIYLITFALLTFVWGIVFGRALVTVSEQRDKATPLWVYFLLMLGLPGLVIRMLLEPLLGRESMAASSVSAKPVVQMLHVRSASVAGISLYLMTLLVEGGCALVRSALLFLPLLLSLIPLHILVLMMTRDSYYGPIPGMFGPTNEYGIDNTLWLVEGVWLILRYTLLITVLVGFSPVLLSLFHALLPIARTGDGATEVESLGAREPTRAEHTKILDTLQEIQARAGGQIAAPSSWRIIDEPVPDAYTIGSTIYLARGAVESPQLAGIVAHELGHIAHQDGDLVLALRRFIIPVAYYIGIDRHPMPAGTVVSVGAGVRQRLIRSEDEKIYYRFQTLQIKFWLAFWLGGMGLLLLGQHWAHFWRQRDFLADDYTVALGFDTQLMEILQQYRHVDVAQPFMLSNRPYTAERLDRLEG